MKAICDVFDIMSFRDFFVLSYWISSILFCITIRDKTWNMSASKYDSVCFLFRLPSRFIAMYRLVKFEVWRIAFLGTMLIHIRHVHAHMCARARLFVKRPPATSRRRVIGPVLSRGLASRHLSTLCCNATNDTTFVQSAPNPKKGRIRRNFSELYGNYYNVLFKKKVNEYYLLEVEGFSEISFWIINLSWMFYLHFLYISLSEFKIIFVIIYFFFIEKNINKNFGEDKHKISDYSN